jgi:hypothetical protein
MVVKMEVGDEILAIDHVLLHGLAFEEILKLIESLPAGKSSVWRIARKRKV